MIKKALLRFIKVLDFSDCKCSGAKGYTCTMHDDYVLVNDALKPLILHVYQIENFTSMNNT